MNDESTSRTQRVSRAVGIVLGIVMLTLVAAAVLGLLVWGVRAIWSAALG